jgi:hypothetical protein
LLAQENSSLENGPVFRGSPDKGQKLTTSALPRVLYAKVAKRLLNAAQLDKTPSFR